jgi:SAM-dependent methyltransferase
MPMAEARYDAIADFYVAGWPDVYDDPPSVALFDLLGPVDGLRVLDVACGHGRISRELARRGAHVVGVDLSAALVEKAESVESLGNRYLHADITSTTLLDGAGFHAAVCGFGLSDIDDLDRAAGAIARAVRPGAVFVFSILHPCFPGDGHEVSGSWPSAGRYHDEGWWRADGAVSSLRRQVGANHRTLSTYLNTLRRHGLWTDELAEPGPADERYPLFLVARCVKR